METTPLFKPETRSIEKSNKWARIHEASISRKFLILLCCILLQLFSAGTGYALGVIYVELIRVFQSSRTDAALVQSVYMGIMTAGGLLFTRAITRYGTGPCVAVGSVVACIGFVISSLAVNISMIIVFTGIVAGFGMCVCYLGAFVTVGWVFHSGAGAPLIVLTVGIAIGQIIFPYVYEALITEYEWHGTFLLLGAITLNCVPIGILFSTSRRFFKIGDDAGSKRRSTLDMSLLKEPTIVLFLLNAWLFSSTGNIEMWFTVDILVGRGYARETGSLMLTIAGVGNVVGRLGGGIITYFLRFPTIIQWIYAAPLVAVCHALVIFFTDYRIVIAAMFVYGVFFGVIAATSPAVMFEASGLERYPQAIAMMSLCNGVGNTLGGLFGGFINDVTGGYDLMFIIAIAVALYVTLSTVVIACCINRSRRRGYSKVTEQDNMACEIVTSKHPDQKTLRHFRDDIRIKQTCAHLPCQSVSNGFSFQSG